MTQAQLIEKLGEWSEKLQAAFNAMTTAAYDECSDNDLVILQGDINTARVDVALNGVTDS